MTVNGCLLCTAPAGMSVGLVDEECKSRRGLLGMMRDLHACMQVRGVEALRQFSRTLVQPHSPAPRGNRIAELEAEVAAVKKRCSELEQQLGAAAKPEWLSADVCL